MYSVYIIENLINHKKYIGSSVRVQKRWKEHINISKNKNSDKYNYPLYCAIRKYGLDNFSFYVIQDDFNSIYEMEEYEQNMITYYNSLTPNGYNQTLFTHSNHICHENTQKYIKKISCKCAKVNAKEEIIEIYNSYHDAARKNNLDCDYESSKIRLVCKGERSSYKNLIFRDLDENNNIISKPIKNKQGKKNIVGYKIDNPEDEIYFESISEASRKLKIERTSISKCIQGSTRYSHVGGYIFREIDIYGDIVEVDNNIDKIIDNYNEKNPIINGERKNITEWCAFYGISKTLYYNRRKKGMGVIKALTTPKRR